MKKTTVLFSMLFVLFTAVVSAFGEQGKSFYFSAGYSLGTKSVNQLGFEDPDQREYFGFLGGWVKNEETPLSGMALKLGLNIDERAFTELNYTIGEGKARIRAGFPDSFHTFDVVDNNGAVVNQIIIFFQGIEYDMQEITIKSSPELSINYSLLNLSNFRLCVGVGIRYVWLENKCDTHKISVDGGGLSPSAKIGVKFPVWGLVSGSVDYIYCPITLFTSRLNPVAGYYQMNLGESNLHVSLGIPFGWKM